MPGIAAVAGNFNRDGALDLASITPGTNGGTLNVMLQHVAQANLSGANLAFSPEPVNSTSSPMTVTLTNSGSSALTISSITTGGNFAQTNTCGSTVPANGSCTISVTFAPTAEGQRQNYLTITDNAPGSPQIITLTGTGTDFALTPTSQTSLTVAPGQVANYAVSINPEAGFSQTVGLSCGEVPNATCTVSPSSITLDGSHSASATIAVVTTGASAALKPMLGSPKLVLAFAMMGGVFGFVGLGGTRAHRKRSVRLFSAVLMFCLASITLTMPACGGSSGGSSGGGTPAGTYTVSVTGTFSSGSSKLSHSTNFALVVQ